MKKCNKLNSKGDNGVGPASPSCHKNTLTGGVIMTIQTIQDNSENSKSKEFIQIKVCSICGESKPADEVHFHANKGGKYGLRKQCRICRNARVRDQIKNPAIAKKRKEFEIKYIASGRCAEVQREWRKKNPEKVKVAAKRYRDSHKDQCDAYVKKYRDDNREQIRAKQRRCDARLQKKPYHVMKKRFKARVRQMIKGGMLGSSEKLFGFTKDELVSHIEKQFTDGMSWDALTKGDIHIDHIRPVSSFNITSKNDPDFKKCWCLDNLQPLWAQDNFVKGSDYDEF